MCRKEPEHAAELHEFTSYDACIQAQQHFMSMLAEDTPFLTAFASRLGYRESVTVENRLTSNSVALACALNLSYRHHLTVC
jgi:hypothetical protein